MNDGDRAQLFFMEAAISQFMQSYESNQSAVGIAVYVDESERKVLDFNLRITARVYRLLAAISIFSRGRVVISEASSFFKLVSDTIKKAFPQMGSEMIMLDFIHSEDVESMVENKDDIPEFWFDNGRGKPYVPTDRRNVWFYERCLSDENRITQKDMYNPGRWPYEEVDYAALRRDNPLGTGRERLEAIEDDDEDDEW